MSQPGASRAAFGFVFVTVAIDMLALGVVIPVIPGLIAEFEGGDTSRAATYYGIFAAVFAAMQFLFSPVLGSLSDRFGRRKILILSNLGLGLDYLVMALAPSLGWLFAGRVIAGITSSSIGTASAYIADVTPPDQRAEKFGMLGVSFGLGFILGPSLGGLLGAGNLRAPFVVSAALSLANALYGFFVLPESLPVEQRAPFRWQKAHPIGALQFLRRRPQLVPLALAGFLSMLAHDSLPSTYVLYTSYRYHWDERTIGLVLAAVGVMSMIVQGALVGRLVKALGERKALALGFLSGAAGMVVYGFAPTGALFCVGIAMTALYGLANPALQALMTGHVGATEQGQLQGAQGSLQGIASMTAPIVFTQLFALAIGPLASWELPGLPFLVAAILLGWALMITAARRPEKRATLGGRHPEP
jgi:DHA1 family tetracycline resistance protein-like MFS transporter